MDPNPDEDDGSFINIEVSKKRIYSKIKGKQDNYIPVNRKPKIPLDKRTRMPSCASLTKYCLPGEKPLRASVTKREELLLSFKEYAKKQHRDRHDQKMSINIRDKYKIYSTELRRRLHIDGPSNDVQTVLDVDKDFYSCVDGRYLPYAPMRFKSLKSLFSDQLRLRQEIGYKKDCVLNIEYSHRNEIAKFNLSVKRYMAQVTLFDTFISEDYHKSMEMLKKWDNLKYKISEIDVERQHLANQLFTITSRLITLDFRFSTLQKYGRFLYYLSPPRFRIQNREFAHSVEIEARGFDFGEVSEDDSFDIMFSKMQTACSGKLTSPVLYFRKSHDIIQVFGENAQQQLHHLTHVMRTSPHSKSLQKINKYLKELTSNDSAVLATVITDFESCIEFYEERANQLEAKFFQVLNGLFYQCVGCPDVLKFTLHLEFCYEKVFYEAPIKMDLRAIGKAIETFWLDYTKRLDAMRNDEVRDAVKQALEDERIKARKCIIAQRELRLFARLEHELLLSFAPVPKLNNKEQAAKDSQTKRHAKIHLSRRISKAPIEIEKKKRSLNESEIEYLRLFTDWTEDENPGNYLQSYNDE